MSKEADPKLDLDAIEKRANAATQGPWHARNDGIGNWYAVPVASGRIGTIANAEFTAHARSDVPALIARVRELEPLVTERLERYYNAWRDRAEKAEKELERQLAHKAVLEGSLTEMRERAHQWRDMANGAITMREVQLRERAEKAEAERDQALARVKELGREVHEWELDAEILSK